MVYWGNRVKAGMPWTRLSHEAICKKKMETMHKALLDILNPVEKCRSVEFEVIEDIEGKWKVGKFHA